MEREQELLERGRRGDLEAFNALVLAYQGQVYNLALRMLSGDGPSAEDVTQETFLRAYQHLPRFRGGSFRSWLLSICANTCRDLLRRGRRRPLSLEALLEQGGEGAHPPSPGPSPEAVAESRRLQDLVHALLGLLPPEQRLAVALVDLQGLDYREASRVMGVPVGTVRSRLARGRAHLRDLLLQRRELLPPPFRPEE